MNLNILLFGRNTIHIRMQVYATINTSRTQVEFKLQSRVQIFCYINVTVLLRTEGRGRTPFFPEADDSAQPSAGRPSAGRPAFLYAPAAVPFLSVSVTSFSRCTSSSSYISELLARFLASDVVIRASVYRLVLGSFSFKLHRVTGGEKL